ncbi:iron ABC transporter permease [Glaciihabitans sp. dw_435]|uniref:FecCD family ABC transporter permease n=1 Tax=Glaciihabitans sp. dw_435 TaxID=2720081 RepID=UPI001BD41E9E|nr:iron ABC transporter permease [Glaciihabitans sp. dw_435]
MTVAAPAPTRAPVVRSQGRRLAITVVVLAILFIATITVSATVGQFPLAPSEILASIGRRIGLVPVTDADRFADGALWNVRFPRILLGAIVGAALGVAGTIMQGTFGNPLAEPGVIGVSAGCAVGACSAIVFHLEFLGGATVPVMAFVFGLLTTFLVYYLSRSTGRTQILTLVLTGIAVNAVANALIALCVFLADTASREQIVFWQLGSLNGASWLAVGTTLPFLVVGLGGALFAARKLDLLALGERQARHLGVNVERLRILSIVCVAILTSAAVAYAGIIAFVGLIIPHLLRLIVGPSHRALIPASALGGAVLISLSDVLARTLVPFADLPIGMFTALVGGPVFFILMRKSLRSGSGLS